MMRYLQLDLGLLSQYRTPLMGLAALMIILCHAPDYGVVIPMFIDDILRRGGLGVDIFLFLSGFGCWFSFSKGVDLRLWYYKRFIRIFVPYLLMQFPFWIWRICNGTFCLTRELMIFSTLDFWLHHVGAWYVALLLPLYLITPLIYKSLKPANCRLLCVLLIVVLLMVVCSLNIEIFNGVMYEILYNLQWAFGRVPSFVIGMAIAPLAQRGVRVNALSCVILPLFLYIVIHILISREAPTQWCLVPPILVVFLLFLNLLSNIKSVFSFISWMGTVSLESYLANIYLCSLMKNHVISLRNSYSVLIGGYVEYTIIILFGVFLAWIVSTVSRPIIVRMLLGNLK